MDRKNGKILISLISVLMVCLIVSTAPATVAAGDWGNLEVGDKIKWKWTIGGSNETISYIEMEIIDISGTDMTYDYQRTIVRHFETYSYTYSYSGTGTDDEKIYFVYSQSRLQRDKADAELANYNWNGTNYKTYHFKWDGVEHYFEEWIDTGTGITLEITRTHGETTYTEVILESTTARLTKAGFCLGTILIAFVSIAAFASYSLARHQERKKKNT